MKRTNRLLILLSLYCASCAHQTTPNGGPKDKAPPVLLKSIPSDNQRNFKDRIVELTFDELIKLSNASEEIVISPSPGKNVQFLARGNKVTIDPKQDWKDSTTYSISFRSAIQDVNESNPIANLRLAFSTGPTIDSLIISGRVSNAMSETIPDKLTVALYKPDTFDITKHTPDFFSQSKKSGSFQITNLKAGRYHVYAFDDKNKNLKVETQSERFAFLPEPIELQKSMDTLSTLSLPVYLIDSRPLKINSIRNAGKITTIKFNKNITRYHLVHQDSPSLLNTFGENQTEVTIFNPAEESDSISVSITAYDSLSLQTDSSFYVKGIKTRAPDDPFKVTYGDAIIDVQTGELSLQVTCSKPILSIQLDSSFIEFDTLHHTPFLKDDFKIDTTVKKLFILKKIDKAFLKPKAPLPTIKFGKGFLFSIQNDSSRKETRNTILLREEETGMLLVTVQTTHKNFIVQLLTTDNKLFASSRDVKNFSFNKLPAQDYKMRVIIDSNGNGVWDPQNLYKKQPAEVVIYYKTPEKKYSFPIRAGWELGPYQFKF